MRVFLLILISIFSLQANAFLSITKSYHTAETDLFLDWISFEGFTQDFEKTSPNTVPMHVTTSGQLNLKHRGLVFGGTAKYPVGWATIITLEYSATPFPPKPNYEIRVPQLPGGIADVIYGSKTGSNIYGIDDHYDVATLTAYKEITEPGYYRVRVWGLSHSSVAPTTNGLIEVNNPNVNSPYNQLILRLEE